MLAANRVQMAAALRYALSAPMQKHESLQGHQALSRHKPLLPVAIYSTFTLLPFRLYVNNILYWIAKSKIIYKINSNWMMIGVMMKPTSEAYDELQIAYDHFNEHLFNNALPQCLITLQREKRTYGYFS